MIWLLCLNVALTLVLLVAVYSLHAAVADVQADTRIAQMPIPQVTQQTTPLKAVVPPVTIRLFDASATTLHHESTIPRHRRAPSLSHAGTRYVAFRGDDAAGWDYRAES